MTAALIGFAIVLGLVLVRMPIVFAMGLVGTLGYAYQRGGSIFDERGMKAAMSMVGRQVMDTAQDYGLSVVPLFILMGLFVNKGGLANVMMLGIAVGVPKNMALFPVPSRPVGVED